MASTTMVGILPPPSYRHRQPPPPSPPPPPPPQTTSSLSCPPSAAAKAASTETAAKVKNQDQPQTERLPQQRQRQGTNDSLAAIARNDSSVKQSVPQTAATGVSIAPLGGPVPGGGGGDVGDLSPGQSFDLSYMHRPPAILPNYGKRTRGSVLPKSNVSRVLLYDNITQQTMLDVRINSIRSQSYKINRELDMHMKSFISRRKIQEKALKKITRVQHLDDYGEFAQEQEPSSPCFPGIGSHKTGHKKLLTSAKSMPALSTQSHQKRSHKKQMDSETPRENSLPRITVSSQSLENKPTQGILSTKLNEGNLALPKLTEDDIQKMDDGNDDNSDDENDDKIRNKVGVQFVSNKGVTRVFKVVTESDISDVIPTPERSSRNENKSPHRPTVGFRDPQGDKFEMDENNNSPTTPDHNETAALSLTPIPAAAKPQHLQPRKSIFQIQKEKEQEDQLQKLQEKTVQRNSLSDIPTDLHPEQPTIDSRFLHLRRLLVPQNPPNEGFAELSPSFPKRYPSLKDLSPRTRRREIARQKRRQDPNDSDADFSEGEDGIFTDSSDDEEEETYN